MGFFLSPIKFVFELIGFLLSAAFVYGLALILCGAFFLYLIADLDSKKPIIETVTVVEKHEVTKFIEIEKEPELICERVAGCEVFPNAVTEKEYCPTCVIK